MGLVLTKAYLSDKISLHLNDFAHYSDTSAKTPQVKCIYPCFRLE